MHECLHIVTHGHFRPPSHRRISELAAEFWLRAWTDMTNIIYHAALQVVNYYVDCWNN